MEETYRSILPNDGLSDAEVDLIRLEAADRLGPDAAREVISQAVVRFLEEERREIWRRRRGWMLHLIRAIELNLDYDLQVRGIAA